MMYVDGDSSDMLHEVVRLLGLTGEGKTNVSKSWE